MKDSLGVRQANLGGLLRLVHSDGPLSRAALTERTGLNRSTIGDLIGELVELGLVAEHAPDPSRRVGRPSPVVTVDPGVVAIAVNPEVDALTMAAVALDQGVIVRRRIESDHLLTPDETARLVGEQVRSWTASELAGRRITGLGVAVPGLVRSADGLVRTAPHLRWHDVALRDLIESEAGVRTVIGNDASLGLIAEHLFGAARGLDHVVYLNGGASGIGGGLIVHGMPVHGADGYAGEFGHNRPGISARADRRAGEGVLEDEVSQSRLLSALQLHSADEPTLAAALAASTAVDVREEVARQRRILSTALANAVNVLNPSAIVLGGFLASLVASDLDGLRAEISQQAMPSTCENLEVRVAVLAEDRLLIGAAEVAFAALLDDPAGATLGAQAAEPSAPVR